MHVLLGVLGRYAYLFPWRWRGLPLENLVCLLEPGLLGAR